jgi:predicted acetyltransferase
MISQIKTIEGFKPLYTTYLNYMSQFYTIYNFELWCKGAMKNLQRYSNSDDYLLYLLKESDATIGFAMISTHLRFNDDGFSVAEFFVQKEYEKKGYGKELAEGVFDAFKGNWEVAVSMKNNLALGFWEHVVASYTDGNFIKKKNDSFDGYAFVFNNGATSERDFLIDSK